MKGHLTGFGISALLHGALLLAVLPLLLWQNKSELLTDQPLTLSLAQFQAAPPTPPAPVLPEPVVPPPVSKPAPQPKPEPKPVAKPKPVEKPKPVKKPVAKPQPVPPREPPPTTEPPSEPAPLAAVAPTTLSAPHPVRQAAASAPKLAPVAPAPAANNTAAEAAYRQKLQSLIAARKQYPRMAEKAEVEGTVTVSFTVLPNGSIIGARVSQSSGNEWLDKAAVQAVNATSGALPFPADIHKARWDFVLKVNFKLD